MLRGELERESGRDIRIDHSLATFRFLGHIGRGVYAMGIHRAKEIILINDRSIIWPSSISTPTGMHELNLKTNDDDRKRGDKPKCRHTTVQRGRNAVPETPELSKTPGLLERSSWLMRVVWSRREAAVGVIHRARRAAKCSGPGDGRFAVARRV